MNNNEWKQIWKILNQLKDKDGFITFPVSVEYTYTNDMSFYTDDSLRIISEELDSISVENTDLANNMLRSIGVNV